MTLRNKKSIFAGLAGLAVIGLGAFVWKTRKRFFNPEDHLAQDGGIFWELVSKDKTETTWLKDGGHMEKMFFSGFT